MTVIGLPEVVDRATYDTAREELLVLEKAHVRTGDKIAARRRQLPMVRMPDYVFDGPAGPTRLRDLFGDQPQLVVQNFMFDPDWDDGCPSCSNLADNYSHDGHMAVYGLAFARISRAPLAKLLAYDKRMGWGQPWVSSGGTTYNEDWGWTVDGGEVPGVSVYLRDGDDVFLTYATTGRGVEALSGLVGYADIAPYGRQEEWEESPPGWPQHPTYASSMKRHDEY